MTTESWVIGVLGVIVFILAADSFFLRYSKRIAFQWDITEQMSRVFQMLEILTSQGRRIMSAFKDYVEAQKGYNSRNEIAIDSIVESQKGVAGDVKLLNDKIADLVAAGPGDVTAADLEELTQKGEAIATKQEGVAAALKALDEQTPPAVPAVPA